MRKSIIWILIAALCLAGCTSALAAAGDRILAHFNNNDGYLSTYISNVFQTEDGICAYLNGQQEKIAVYGEGTEPTEYTLEMEALLNTDQEEGEAYVYVQTAGWFSWNGELYVIQYHNVSIGESNTIEGGFVKKAKLADGTILLEDCDIPQLDWSGMVEDYGGWQGSRYLNRLLVSGDRLIGTTWDNNGQNLLVMFDLTTGFAEEIPLQDVEGIYPGPDGTLLMTRYEWAEEIRRLYEV